MMVYLLSRDHVPVYYAGIILEYGIKNNSRITGKFVGIKMVSGALCLKNIRQLESRMIFP